MVTSKLETSAGEERVLLFNVGDRSFCIPVESVREVVHIPTLAHPPAVPSILEGFLNLEGTAVAVVRLDEVFGLPRQEVDAYTPLIVLRQSDAPIAFLVQRVIGIRSVPSDMVLPLQQNTSFNGCIEKNFQLDTGVIHAVSLSRLLLEKERRTISYYQTLEAERLRDLAPLRA